MKRFARLIAFLLLVLGFVYGTSFAAPMPWRAFNGEMAKASVGSSLGRCPQGEVFMAGFRHEDALYVMYVATENQRLVFFFDPHPNDQSAPPTEVGFGVVDPSKPDAVPPIRWESFDPQRHSNVCSLLFSNVT